jgi:uncharacterized protein (DUF3820 family)
MPFSEKEAKLYRMALDKAASEGEIANAAIALIRSLRDRGVSAYDTKESSNFQQQPPPPRPDDPNEYLWPGTIRMPWGKHQGTPLAEIDPGYLRWCVEHFERHPRNEDLLDCMQWLLDDLASRTKHKYYR